MRDAQDTLARIRAALDAAAKAITPFVPGQVQAEFKHGGEPVTEADRAANCALREALLRNGEGWFSEESVDDQTRFKRDRVWIVDPLDGTREFVEGIPEWCVSVALVERGRAVAGGITNPTTGETILGSLATGVTYNGRPVSPTRTTRLDGAVVLASRSEVKRGEWQRFEGAPFVVRPMGSVAYKLGLVAAGHADATWTLCSKHEWDVAAGVALVEASGGFVQTSTGAPPRFGHPQPLFPGLIASAPSLRDAILEFLSPSA